MKPKSVASFTVRCEEAGFSRTAEIPIANNGHVRKLVEDLEDALDLYQTRVENARLRTALEEIWDAFADDDENRLANAINDARHPEKLK